MNKGLSRVIGGLLVFFSIIITFRADAATCPLTAGLPYKSSESAKIYLVTKNCTKQHFPNPQIYLSYFPSFRSVRMTTATKLNLIPNDIQASLGKKGSPQILFFKATPSTIKPGQISKLSWLVKGATKLLINEKPVLISGTPFQILPTSTSAYSLTAVNSIGQTKATIVVTVRPEGPTIPSLPEASVAPSSYSPADIKLTNEGLGATRGPDKPQGLYTPILYKELTLKASRNETIGFFVRGNVSVCEKVEFSEPSGIKIQFFELPLVTTNRKSAPSMFLGQQFDPAVPKTNAEICPSNGGWAFMDLTVAPGATPGIYDIPMRLSGSGKELKLHVKVWPMTLSSTEEAMPSYWIYDEWAGVQQHFGGKWDDPYRSELYKLYLHSMRQHRMTAVNSEMAPLKIINVNGKPQLDVESNGYLDLVINNRPQNALISIPWDRSRDVTSQREYLAAAENTVKERGWQDKAYIYLTDEPAHSTFSYVAEQAKIAKQIAPSIKTMVTTVADQKLIPFIDIFVVLIDQIQAWNFPAPEVYKKLMGEGKQIWLYFSCDSHGCASSSDTEWPDLMIDNPGVHARTVGWMNDHYGTNGFLYYYTNLAYYKGNPFLNQFDFGGNGDGNLFYPGKPGEFSLTSHQPIPSLRMKIFRESANDAEYLKSFRKTQMPRQLKDRVDSIVKSSTDWSKNFQDYQLLRDDIGEYLATGTVPHPIEADFDRTWKAISMSIHQTGGLVNHGLDWSIWNNGHIGEKIYFPKKGSYKLTVLARGDMAGNDLPRMEIKVDGRILAAVEVDSSSFKEYVFPASLEAGEHQIDIVFTNDYNDPVTGNDRNLIVNKMRIQAN